jgi:hypothetical protein
MAKKSKSKSPKAKPSASKGEKRVSGLDAAAVVLGAAKKPMRIADIMESIQKRGLWKSPGGKTPGATVNAAIIREIAAKGKESRFRKAGRGLFAAAR